MELRVNDIYKFRYNEEQERLMVSPYHCFDGILTVKEYDKRELVLVDGYWSSENKWFTLKDALEKGKLTLICNLNETEKITEHESKYYDEKDIFILPFHSGYNTVWLKRKSAEKSREVMLNHLKNKVEDRKQKLESAKRALEMVELDYQKALIEEDLNKIYL